MRTPVVFMSDHYYVHVQQKRDCTVVQLLRRVARIANDTLEQPSLIQRVAHFVCFQT